MNRIIFNSFDANDVAWFRTHDRLNEHIWPMIFVTELQSLTLVSFRIQLEALGQCIPLSTHVLNYRCRDISAAVWRISMNE